VPDQDSVATAPPPFSYTSIRMSYFVLAASVMVPLFSTGAWSVQLSITSVLLTYRRTPSSLVV
jgi:hypothetical protein